MAEGIEAQEKKFKEVVVVFWNKRRPVKFEVSKDPSKDRSSLLSAVHTAFSDVFPDLAASPSEARYVFQTESKIWGELVDMAGEIQDHSTVFVKQTRNFTLEGVQVLDKVLSGNSAFYRRTRSTAQRTEMCWSEDQVKKSCRKASR